MATPTRTKAPKAKDTTQRSGHVHEPTYQSVPPTFQSHLLGLQRTAGNHAVSQGLQQSTAHSSSVEHTVPPIVHEVLRSPGQPLDPDTRTLMESRFGYDFGQVRVHTDNEAAQSAVTLHAQAYTLGNDIAFGKGRYQPDASSGKRLLAHELAHVIQQGRGGPPTAGSRAAQLEQHADHATSAAARDTGTVAVAGSAAPGIMYKPKNEEELDPEERSRKARQREKTLRRKQERAHAGKDVENIVHKQAEAELRALEEEARSPGAKSWSLKKKEQKLRRFEEVLKDVNMPKGKKSSRKGAYDEALRTPTRTAGEPQTKYVSGIPEQPGMELPPEKRGYAQPDYSIWRRRPDGTFERFHVNLKSHKLHEYNVSDARAAAKDAVEQAIRNTRRLPEGETIIISYARSPSEIVQQVMLAELFRKGSGISEVHFGTTTYRRSEYKGPVSSAPTRSKTKPMRALPGGRRRAGFTATQKKVTSQKPSSPEVSTLNRPSHLGPPEYSAAPDTPPPTKRTEGQQAQATKLPVSATTKETRRRIRQQPESGAAMAARARRFGERRAEIRTRRPLPAPTKQPRSLINKGEGIWEVEEPLEKVIGEGRRYRSVRRAKPPKPITQTVRRGGGYRSTALDPSAGTTPTRTRAQRVVGSVGVVGGLLGMVSDFLEMRGRFIDLHRQIALVANDWFRQFGGKGQLWMLGDGSQVTIYSPPTDEALLTWLKRQNFRTWNKYLDFWHKVRNIVFRFENDEYWLILGVDKQGIRVNRNVSHIFDKITTDLTGE